MIDWLTILAPLRHRERITSGVTMHVTPEGEREWEKHKAFQARGSFESSTLIWTHPDPSLHRDGHWGWVWVSGNPAKFLQGHNVFGSTDIRALTVAWLEKISECLGLEVNADDRADWQRGNVGISRVDVTESFDFGNRSQVRNAIRSLERLARVTHRGRGSLKKGGTLYWGRESDSGSITRRWYLKCYAKGDEIQSGKKHALPADLPMRNEVEQHADGLLRFELTLLSMELQRLKLGRLMDWEESTATELHRATMAKLEISEAFMLNSDVLETLPGRLRTAHQLWVEGHDLRSLLARPTFYRYRKELLKHGVDIAVKRDREEPPQSNVIPLPVVLHGYPVGIPTWAKNTPIYFDPPKRLRSA